MNLSICSFALIESPCGSGLLHPPASHCGGGAVFLLLTDRLSLFPLSPEPDLLAPVEASSTTWCSLAVLPFHMFCVGVEKSGNSPKFFQLIHIPAEL